MPTLGPVVVPWQHEERSPLLLLGEFISLPKFTAAVEGIFILLTVTALDVLACSRRGRLLVLGNMRSLS